MSLPKIEYPTFELEIPSTKEKIRYRPFLVKEEKILLIAQQSQNINDVVFAIKQIITNCVLTAGFDIDQLMLFDVEYIFLKLRANSVNNIINLTYKDNEDGKNYNVQIDLNDVNVEFNPEHTNKIRLSENTMIILKYPGMELPKEVIEAMDTNTSFFEMVKSCLDKLIVGEEIFYFSDATEEEKKEFLEGLTITGFNQIRKFFETMPKLKHTISYKNSLGHVQEIVLETLNDFFMYR